MLVVSLRQRLDCDGYEFQIASLDNKIWHFEAGSVEEREEWVTAIGRYRQCQLRRLRRSTYVIFKNSFS